MTSPDSVCTISVGLSEDKAIISSCITLFCSTRQIMTELVETEEDYVKKLGHVCEVSNTSDRSHNIIVVMIELHRRN